MARLLLARNEKVRGPWILNQSDLEGLAETIQTITQKIEVANELEAEAVASGITNPSDDHYQNVLSDIKSRYPYSETEDSVTLVSGDEKRLHGRNLTEVLKDGKLSDFKPEQLVIEIKRGHSRFQMLVERQFKGYLEIKTPIADEDLLSDVKYEFNKWAERHKPNFMKQLWSGLFPDLAYMILLFVFAAFASLWLMSIDDREDQYRDELSAKMDEVAIGGVSDQEINLALELILKAESGVVPKGYKPTRAEKDTPQGGYSYLILFISVIVALAITPKTTIGVGKNRSIASFYRKWNYVVLVFVPSSILLPIFLNRLF